jgi:hypothetical protein
MEQHIRNYFLFLFYMKNRQEINLTGVVHSLAPPSPPSQALAQYSDRQKNLMISNYNAQASQTTNIIRGRGASALLPTSSSTHPPLSQYVY